MCLSVSRHCLSCLIERGNPWERATSIQFWFYCQKRVQCSHHFLAITQTERMVDRTGKPVGESTGMAVERESSGAQIRTLFDNKDKRSSRTPICSSRTRTQNSTRRIMASAKRIFVKFINKILLRWRNYENSRVLPSIHSQDRSSSRIRTLLWNYQEDYKHCKMK